MENSKVGIGNDEVSISSNGSCITIKAQNHMLWWAAFAKYYYDTTPEAPETDGIEMSWEDTKASDSDKIIDTTFKYSNKRAGMSFSTHIYSNGTITIQGKTLMLKKWYETHYPCIIGGKNIENITTFPSTPPPSSLAQNNNSNDEQSCSTTGVFEHTMHRCLAKFLLLSDEKIGDSSA